MQATTIADFLGAILSGVSLPARHRTYRPADAGEDDQRRWNQGRSDQHILEDVYRLHIDDRVRSLLR